MTLSNYVHLRGHTRFRHKLIVRQMCHEGKNVFSSLLFLLRIYLFFFNEKLAIFNVNMAILNFENRGIKNK